MWRDCRWEKDSSHRFRRCCWEGVGGVVVVVVVVVVVGVVVGVDVDVDIGVVVGVVVVVVVGVVVGVVVVATAEGLVIRGGVAT